MAELRDREVDLRSAPDSIPDGARDVVRTRVARLPAPARRALETAAVIGSDFDELLFNAVADEHARAGLDEAVASGFLQRAGRRLLFTHDIVRGAIATTGSRNTPNCTGGQARRWNSSTSPILTPCWRTWRTTS
ncbi:MAG: hypothetical protein ACR2HQ_05100 [Ilumatobacteraceae bacterium]